MNDVCDNCEHEHEVDFQNGYDRLHIFLTEVELNHVLTVCPNCNFGTRIYINVVTTLELAGAGCPMSLWAEAPDELREGYKRACEAEQEQEVVQQRLELLWNEES